MRDARRDESGFALVLALLSLLLLTFLGLTLATTTSTELQIANNYRWGQQALYNAESGLELAKVYLQENTAWQIFVPAARDASTIAAATAPPTDFTRTPVGPAGEANRSYENQDCDTGQGHMGYGPVLAVPGFAYPFQNVSTFFGETISGSFTIWARRKTQLNNAGELSEVQTNDRLILTAEGTAPYQYVGSASSGYATSFRKRAVRTIQLEVQKIDPSECENSFQGQAGLGALNSNYDACNAVTASGIKNAVSEVNPNN